MKETIAGLLRPFGDWIFGIILSVPLWAVKLVFLGILAALAIWVLTLPAQRATDQDGNEKSVFTDLRLFAIGLLALQSICYLVF